MNDRCTAVPLTRTNALFALFISGILAYGAGFAWYMLTRFDLVDLTHLNPDDAFYYFQIAYNLAEGKFSTFDGGITQTNGYHPIWMLLITPFYWIFDKEAAVFAIRAFEIMLIAGGVALITAAARLARLPWYLMFAALPMLYEHRGLFKGMEAATALFMLGLFILVICLFARNPARWRWPLAAVAFALPWARLEYIAISLAATAALCLLEWSWQDSPPSPVSLRKRIHSIPTLKALPSLFGAVAGVLVYFAYNRLVFGGAVPVSGAIKQEWSRQRWEQEGGYSFLQNFQDILQLRIFDWELLVALSVCACLLLAWWSARRSRSRDDWLLLAFLVGVSGVAAGHLAMFAQHVLMKHPDSLFPSWYYVPAYLVMALLVPLACAVAVHVIRRLVALRSSRMANILSATVIAAGAVFLLFNTGYGFTPFQYVDQISRHPQHREDFTNYLGTQVMNRVLPEDSIIGSWSAGVIGYFSRFPVVNLDGLVNSYDYMRAISEGRAAKLHPQFGITHFANTRPANQRINATLFEGPPYLNRRGLLRQFKLWSAEPAGVSSGEFSTNDAWFWERMKPHFDLQQGDVGLTVDTRIAQVFARNCAPDDLAAVFWAGRNTGSFRTAPLKQNRNGLCVAVMLLPRGAGQVQHVVKIELSEPIISSVFDVYLLRGGRLVYSRQPCRRDDNDARFFLHVFPVDERDLSDERRQYGFDNLDFWMEGHPSAGGRCTTVRRLPDYPVAKIRTGQFTGEGQLWEGTVVVANPGSDGSPTP